MYGITYKSTVKYNIWVIFHLHMIWDYVFMKNKSLTLAKVGSFQP